MDVCPGRCSSFNLIWYSADKTHPQEIYHKEENQTWRIQLTNTWENDYWLIRHNS